mgnify:CR=1 FL=1
MTRVLRPDEILPGYDRWAACYDTVANPLVTMTEHVLDQVPLGAAGQDVVELGCGTGRNTARVLAEGACSYTGVDGSPGMLARARALGEPRVRWKEADLHTRWNTEDRFDLAFIVLVLEHIVDLAPLVKTLSTIVRPGGRVRIVDIHPELVESGTGAHFHDGDDELRFTSVAHTEAALRAAFMGWRVAFRSWISDDAMIALVPRLAKHRGRAVLLDVTATR